MSTGIEILAHLGVPFIAGLVLLLIIAASDKNPISWDTCNDIGLDLSILSVGACGGIFANPTLIQHLGANSAVYGIVVVLCDSFFAGVLVYIRRWRNPPVDFRAGLRDLFFGLLTIGITGGCSTLACEGGGCGFPQVLNFDCRRIGSCGSAAGRCSQSPQRRTGKAFGLYQSIRSLDLLIFPQVT